MDRSDVVRRAAQKVVRAGYVVYNHRVACGSYLGAPFDKSLRLKKQIFLVVMPKKRRPEYERKLKLIRQRILTPSDVAKSLQKKSKK